MDALGQIVAAAASERRYLAQFLKVRQVLAGDALSAARVYGMNPRRPGCGPPEAALGRAQSPVDICF